MLQAQIKKSFITPVERDSDKIVENIKKTIRKSKTSNMTFDISMLNLIDASKVATIASTYHFLKFAEGSINWIVNSKEIENLIKPLNLGNNKFTFVR